MADLEHEFDAGNREEVPTDGSYIPLFNVLHLRAGPLADPWIA